MACSALVIGFAWAPNDWLADCSGLDGCSQLLLVGGEVEESAEAFSFPGLTAQDDVALSVLEPRITLCRRGTVCHGFRHNGLVAFCQIGLLSML